MDTSPTAPGRKPDAGRAGNQPMMAQPDGRRKTAGAASQKQINVTIANKFLYYLSLRLAAPSHTCEPTFHHELEERQSGPGFPDLCPDHRPVHPGRSHLPVRLLPRF